MKNYFLIIFTILSTITYGQDTWTKTTQTSSDNVVFVASHMPSAYQLFNIDISSIKNELQSAPRRFSRNIENSDVILEFPDKQGNLKAFRILEASIMEVELAAQFPMIKTYIGESIDDPTSSLRMSIGTDGLHVMIYTDGKASLFIDPYTRNRDKYIAYSADDLSVLNEFRCDVENEITPHRISEINSPSRNITDGILRQYNLAVATTIEYSAFHLTNQNVPSGASMATKKAAVLSAITNTINRVIGIYERELSVTFVLNANEANIIFIDSDDFSNDNSNELYNQSQIIIDQVIGNPNYDVGHTFSTGAGGQASLGGICTTIRKAKAITGTSNPIGDAYDIDYVAHEMGHHFGANHSYNGEGAGLCTTSTSGTSAEPGSGSTIMAYAGVCIALNVQNHADAYFHAVSLQEINNRFTNTGAFTNSSFYLQCSSNTNTGNNEPIANAGIDYVIPKGTAFVLTGSANDPDGDALTYCWDQIDLQQPNIYPLASTTTTGPLYRSFSPTSSPKRFMPKFSTVFGGNLASTWEVTPSVGRNLNFSLTARDNKVGGQNTSDNVLITVSNTAGPFKLTSQTGTETWATGQSKTITWDVAGTATNGVNVTQVEITLVNSNGTVLSVLSASTGNDGSHTITVPNITNNNTRIKISAINNIFYAVNSGLIAINAITAYCSTLCSSSGRYVANNANTFDGTTLVSFNTINNVSTGLAAYSNYTSISTNVVMGQSYTLKVNVNTAGGFNELAKAWIDWNRDCDFNDAGEEYDLGEATNVTNGQTSITPTITIPASALLGDTRMRITSAYNDGSFPTSCESNFAGEVEDYTLNVISTALPVDLIKFEASVVREKFIQLDWQTASEINNEGFELQRSNDGARFETINWIEGSGTAVNKNNYDYVDKSVISNQIYYYRLKQVDHDGQFNYSKIQSVIIRNNDTEINVYPNPAVDEIFINVEENRGLLDGSIFELYDALGNKAVTQRLNANIASIPIHQFPYGIYIYRIISKKDVLKSGKLFVK